MIFKGKEDSVPMDSKIAVLPETRKYLMRREIISHRLYQIMRVYVIGPYK